MERPNENLEFCRGSVVVRPMHPQDIPAFEACLAGQGWPSRRETYLRRLTQASLGTLIALTAQVNGEIAGHICLYPRKDAGPFQGMAYIEDLLVFERFQHKGVASLLMDAAESVAQRFGSVVTLGVGLHSGYGRAQRMYARRGYVPDGSGVWYGDAAASAYETVCNDDCLILYLKKDL